MMKWHGFVARLVLVSGLVLLSGLVSGLVSGEVVFAQTLVSPALQESATPQPKEQTAKTLIPRCVTGFGRHPKTKSNAMLPRLSSARSCWR